MVRRLSIALVGCAVLIQFGPTAQAQHVVTPQIVATEGAAFTGQLDSRSTNCPLAAVTATIDWGDQATSTAATTHDGNGHLTVSGTHTYARYGTYAGKVSGQYSCLNAPPIAFSDPFGAIVADAALSATGTTLSATVGVPLEATVTTFTDANTLGRADADTADVDWGDGTVTAGAVSSTGGSSYAVRATHTYAAPGPSTITVHVADGGTSTATATSSVTVAAAPVVVSIPPPRAPPAAPPPSVRAAITGGTLAPGRLLVDASSSIAAGARAARFEWRTGDGQDIVCPGSEPGLALSVGRTTRTLLTLTATDATSGLSTTASRSIAIPAPGRHASPASAPAVGVCTGSAGLRVPPLKSLHLPTGRRPSAISLNGGPPEGCNQDIVFGAADLHGCFAELPDPRQIPGGIDGVLRGLLCGAHDSDFCLAAIGGAIRAVRTTAASGPSPGRAVTAAFGHLRLPSYYSYTAVRLNGIDIDPQHGTPILVVPSSNAFIAPDARVLISGRLVLKGVPLGIYLPSGGGHLGDITLPHSLPLIGSLPFTGSLGIDLRRAHSRLANGDVCTYSCAAISVNASLPSVLSDGDGNGVQAAGVLTADAVQGLQLDSLEVRVGSASLAGIGVSDVDARYRRGDDSLHAQATFKLFDAVGTIGGSVDFARGRFNGASLQYTAGDGPGIDLGGPLNLYLTSLGGAVTLSPTVIDANATITGGPQTQGCALFGITGTTQIAFDPFAFDADAQGQLLCQHVSDEYFHLDNAGNIRFGGSVDLPIWLLEIKGGIDVAVDVPQGHFQFDGDVAACIKLFGTHCLGAEVVLSDKGSARARTSGSPTRAAGSSSPTRFTSSSTPATSARSAHCR